MLNYINKTIMAKLSKQSITELVRIAISTIVSVLTTLGIISCTVYSGNQTTTSKSPATTQQTQNSNQSYNY